MTSKTPSTTPNTTSRRTPAQPARLPITLERARDLCPTANLADAVSDTFGLYHVDFDEVRATTADHLQAIGTLLDKTLHERQLLIHMQRVTQAFVASAFNAGQFYSEKVSEARRLTAALTNNDRDEDHGEGGRGPVGFESKAERARLFAAQACMQAFALLAAAQGAVDAFLAVTGEHWKPYVGSTDKTQTVARKAADLEIGAFG
jgi:hypothetical protein